MRYSQVWILCYCKIFFVLRAHLIVTILPILLMKEPASHGIIVLSSPTPPALIASQERWLVQGLSLNAVCLAFVKEWKLTLVLNLVRMTVQMNALVLMDVNGILMIQQQVFASWPLTAVVQRAVQLVCMEKRTVEMDHLVTTLKLRIYISMLNIFHIYSYRISPHKTFFIWRTEWRNDQWSFIHRANWFG